MQFDKARVLYRSFAVAKFSSEIQTHCKKLGENKRDAYIQTQKTPGRVIHRASQDWFSSLTPEGILPFAELFVKDHLQRGNEEAVHQFMTYLVRKFKLVAEGDKCPKKKTALQSKYLKMVSLTFNGKFGVFEWSRNGLFSFFFFPFSLVFS